MAKRTIEYQGERVEVDPETGEIKNVTKETVVKTMHNPEPPYVKLYIDDVLYMSDMPKSLSSLTYSLLKRARYADKGLRVDLSTYVKQEILAECGYEKLQSVTNAIGKLCKGNIIKRLGVGTYQLNPYLFGIGPWKDIDNIRMTWDYSAVHGRTFSVDITHRNDEEVEVEGEGQGKPGGGAAREVEGEGQADT